MQLFQLPINIFEFLWNAILTYIFRQPSPKQPIPLSVNYHLTRACNYRCKFCFHTALTNDRLPLEEAKRGIRLLQQAGTKKINFSGGEPFFNRSRKICWRINSFC